MKNSVKSHRVSAAAQRLRYVLADWVSGCVAFFVFNIIRFYLFDELDNGFHEVWNYIFSQKLILEQCIVPVGMLIVYWFSGYYNIPFGKSRLQELGTTILSAIINTILIYLVLLINDQTGKRLVNYEIIIILFGLLFVITYIVRVCITEFAINNFRKHSWDFKLLVIGNSQNARKVASRLLKGQSRVTYEIAGYVEIPGEPSVKDNADVYKLDDVEDVVKKLNIDHILIAPKAYQETKILSLVYKLFHLGKPIKISPDTLSFLTSGIKLKDIYGEPLVDLTTPALSESSKNIKRFFDVFISALLLLIFSPLFLVLAILVKKGSKGPVFYNQERIGLRQQPFFIHKFRTMKEDAESEGPRLSSENDERITKVGRWMRKYRFDELPQFWNVLKGEMSIVGPRPEREFFIRQIVKQAPYYALVCQVRPGITSWGMVKYGYASNVRQMVERTRYDLIYLSNMSLFVDLKILIYTVKTVITGKGV